ncbi:interleukin-6 receptor subunit beta-like [Polyodon spathula]|uniref:interleukin-6 receptor subunit beta-like n=1 Tax=Polyodon spathula TaxID=7913 RepID=UPI001B7E06B5|nr:interleukin-6 receptor subunit beta-like [Polyodon spathula]XP_041085862.1 interleukin-6 receptor subunit beta-like [Polyodon spathula]XP_041085873.1 interleukin-6 receptor subunit beta-like [Polyodon spathula]XP_041085882.1 interleukin-6 receptor subunit beta-like [Polyodon spathula]XP_041085892.1 interleukin-6 receptor subunit beta-like [Polyodon spathula]XP_041085900.1 interleukin-6 receptor subunit beta-like [Polyodon spathula]
MHISQNLLVLILFGQLNVLCVMGGLDLQCGVIEPVPSAVELHTEFTATCVLFESCIDQHEANADNMYWKFQQHRVPKEQYTKINDTAIRITVNITDELRSPLTCNVMSYGQMEHNIYGIFLNKGFPPEKPQNLTCIVHQYGKSLSDTLLCTWNPGRESHLVTRYTLKAQTISNTSENISRIDEGELKMTTMPVFVNVRIWVEAENQLGKSTSEKLHLDPVDIVKPSAPEIEKISSEKEFPNSLVVSWNLTLNPLLFKLKYNIRYRSASSSEWTEVPLSETGSSIKSFRLQDLKPYTEYRVSVRCIKEDGLGYWSDWSKEKSATTPEAKPSGRPDLWRVIGPSDSDKNRRVTLIWKEPDPSVANGKILGYEVQIEGRHYPAAKRFTVNGTSVDYTLTEGASYHITIAAFNSKGQSPGARLFIPAGSQKELPSVEDLKAFPQDGKLWVEWKAPRKSESEYVVEWCAMMEEGGGCSTESIEWQRVSALSINTVLKGNIKPLKRYKISVFPVYFGIPGACRSVEEYLEQGSPTIGPTVRTRKKERNGALLEWNLIPLMSRNGFIRNYTIFYQAEGGVEESITVDYTNRQYTLTSLGTSTMYAVHVSANTDAGGKNGSEFTFTTLKFAPGEIEAIVVPVCLGFLITTVATLLFCFNKRDLIKKHIWPQVPDPGNSRIANWSPDSGPIRPNFSPKEQVYPEGIITDFSVINIENDNIDDYNKASDSLKKGKYTSEEHSSGIGGSSCMSSPRQSVSDSDEADSAQTTSSTVQYSSVVATGYRGQLPSAPVFARSESTQPLLDCEERPEEQHLYGNLNSEQGVRRPSRLYFKRPRMINEDADPSCDSLGFCPADEVTLQDSAATGSSQPDSEGQTVPRNGINASPERNETKSYVPQQNGYRAQ